MLLFDADRDGIISFGTDDAKDMSDYTHPDPNDLDPNKYKFDRTQNYRFWVNNASDSTFTQAFPYLRSDETGHKCQLPPRPTKLR